MKKLSRLSLTALSVLAVTAVLCLLCTSCTHSTPTGKESPMGKRTRDSLSYLELRHYTWGTNFILQADSADLALLPVKDSYFRLYKGDRVVVAEFAIHPGDETDSVWVKLAHSQEGQGWLREAELKRAFVPADSISQAIHLFSRAHVFYAIALLALFMVAWFVRASRRKRLLLVYFNDINSVYPLLLCLLTAFCAMTYESIQMFAPAAWEHYYYNPTLSPLKVPFPVSLFLAGLWAMLIVLLAACDVVFRRLTFFSAASYLLGLAACCCFCYFFFIFATQFYVGYLCFALFVWIFIRRLHASLQSAHYRCGYCNAPLVRKGTCPHCGSVNE